MADEKIIFSMTGVIAPIMVIIGKKKLVIEKNWCIIADNRSRDRADDIRFVENICRKCLKKRFARPLRFLFDYSIFDPSFAFGRARH